MILNPNENQQEEICGKLHLNWRRSLQMCPPRGVPRRCHPRQWKSIFGSYLITTEDAPDIMEKINPWIDFEEESVADRHV